MNETHLKRQLMKFNVYGFLKNLKFFDPFLWVYLTETGLNLTKIGLLLAIRETIIYLFEIPSGVLADKYGKKTELIICFLFYIASFVFFFIGTYFYIFVIAFVLFGFGEAFRSGTHKSIIMDFMEYHDMKDVKSKIYGLTRSYSLLGSALSSVVGILFVLYLPGLEFLFILAIIPYVLDLLLILSYPNYLNFKQENSLTFKEIFVGMINVIVYFFKEKDVRIIVLDSAGYNAIFKAIKDYIQPILVTLLAGMVLIEWLDNDSQSEVLIGITYTVAFIISSFASKYSHKLLNRFNRSFLIHGIWIIALIIMSVLYLFKDDFIIVIVMFLSMYVFQNIRKPLVVESIGNVTDKHKRASVLSVESQLTSIIVIVLAPTLGLLYDHFGIEYVFLMIAILNMAFYALTVRFTYK